MALIDVHHPLILVFGILGNLSSTCVYFAPIPTFILICKSKSTMGFQSLPYVISMFSSLVWLFYAFTKEGDTFLLITVNALGSLIELVYVTIFIAYATPCGKKQTIKILSVTIVLCMAISLGSFFFLQKSTRVFFVGWICVAIYVCVFASPLMIVFQVVKTKSIEFMPFPLSCLLTLNAIMWFTYGVFTSDLCVTMPNVIGFILGVIQIALYQYYKQMSKVVMNKIPEIKLPEHIIIIKASNAEVYPVDSSQSSGIEGVEEKEKKVWEAGCGEAGRGI